VHALAFDAPQHCHCCCHLPGCALLHHAQASISIAGRFKAMLSRSLCGLQSKLEAVPASIADVSSLQFLELYSCSHLKSLPDTIVQLLALQELRLRSCSRLQALPLDLGIMRSLAVLDLSGCCSLSELPGGLGRLRSLQQLDLRGCSKLERLPPSVWDLNQLHKYGPPRAGGAELPPPPPVVSKLKPLPGAPKDSFTLLSIDGGGMRGLIPGEFWWPFFLFVVLHSDTAG
jgi:hypothetical protein